MKKRQFIILAIAALILVAGKLFGDLLATPKEKAAKKTKENISTVFTETVQNDSIPIIIESTGILEAVKRMELYSEVQGTMLFNEGKFKAGNEFKKGEILVSIRSNDQQAQLNAQRSTFESIITSILPDLKIDYPKAFTQWSNYLKTLSTNQSLQKLPEVNSEQLRAFLVGRGIYNGYHTLKNSEIATSKYTLRAPYNGVLITSNVDPGTVIRQGQALGTFIQPEQYEMEASIDAVSADFLQVEQSVKLTMENLIHKQWEGKITRLVKAININSQMSSFYIAVEGNDLKEGMFLTASVKANEIPNAYEISRSALIDQSNVYVVQADTLLEKAVTLLYLTSNTAIISGLKNGEQVLSKIPPSAFPGMKVSIYKE